MNSLPNEVLREILLYCHPREFKSVCKLWRDFFSLKGIQTQFPSYLKYLYSQGCYKACKKYLEKFPLDKLPDSKEYRAIYEKVNLDTNVCLVDALTDIPCNALLSNPEYRKKSGLFIICGRLAAKTRFPCRIEVSKLGDTCVYHKNGTICIPDDKPYFYLAQWSHKKGILNSLIFRDHFGVVIFEYAQTHGIYKFS